MNKVIKNILRAPRRKKGAGLIRIANGFRDRGEWSKAAQAYRDAFAVVTWRYDLLVQAGNCLKEYGDYDSAQALYQEALEGDKAQEAEARRQMQHVEEQKTARKNREQALYEPDARILPDGLPIRRRRQLRLERPVSPETVLGNLSVSDRQGEIDLGTLDLEQHVPATDRIPDTDHLLSGKPHLALFQIGDFVFDHYGVREPLLMGVVAVRMMVLSTSVVERIFIYLDDVMASEEKPVLVKKCPDGKLLYVCNSWIDCDRQLPGSQTLSARAIPQKGAYLVDSRVVNVVRTPPSFSLPASDSFVPSPRMGYTDLTQAVTSLPPQVRSADDGMFLGNVRNLLIMRVDQLGDISASLPAMQRLREIFPKAHITIMVPPVFTEVVKASGISDDILNITLDYNIESEKRYIKSNELKRVGGVLKKKTFDLAIDLCPAHETRRILLMVNARYRVGFAPLSFPFLDFGIEVSSRDKSNGSNIVPHAAFILSLVESLRVSIPSQIPVVKRVGDDREILEKYKLAKEKYIVIHSGARHSINCWPLENFLQLADRLAAHTDMPVVFFSDKKIGADISGSLAEKDNILFLNKVGINEFDALISNAHLMVGNDSGPKHLAAARGVYTASIHINRLNWREWGQIGRGIIISKKVPCCGCGLNNEVLCGKDVACVRTISVDDVFSAINEKYIMAQDQDASRATA